MKAFNNYFYVVIVCMFGIVFQACWKDKTIKDRGIDPHLNISPSFGVPVVDLTIRGEDVAKRINKDSATRSYYIDYDNSDYDLGVIVYDKDKRIPAIVLPSNFTTYTDTVDFALDFFSDLRKRNWRPQVAYVDLYIDNSYTTAFDLSVENLSYEIQGNTSVITTSGLVPTRIEAAQTAGTPKRTLLLGGIRVDKPTEMVLQGIRANLIYKINNSSSPTNGQLKILPIIRVPMHMEMDDEIRVDTTAVDFGGISDLLDNEVISAEGVTLYFIFKNALPMDAKVQVFFADENHRILDSLKMTDIYVNSGVPDNSTYLINTPVITNETVSMTKEQFKKIKDTKYLIIRETYTSYKSQSPPKEDIKVFKSSYMNILLSVKVDAKINGRISDIERELTDTTNKK